MPCDDNSVHHNKICQVSVSTVGTVWWGGGRRSCLVSADLTYIQGRRKGRNKKCKDNRWDEAKKKVCTRTHATTTDMHNKQRNTKKWTTQRNAHNNDKLHILHSLYTCYIPFPLGWKTSLMRFAPPPRAPQHIYMCTCDVSIFSRRHDQQLVTTTRLVFFLVFFHPPADGIEK